LFKEFEFNSNQNCVISHGIKKTNITTHQKYLCELY